MKKEWRQDIRTLEIETASDWICMNVSLVKKISENIMQWAEDYDKKIKTKKVGRQSCYITVPLLMNELG